MEYALRAEMEIDIDENERKFRSGLEDALLEELIE